MQFRILGTRSKMKELRTLLIHEKGTMQNTNVGWVRNKTESSRLGKSNEDWVTKKLKNGNYNLNQEPARNNNKTRSFIHALRTNKE